MTAASSPLQHAYALFQQGKLQEAEAFCRETLSKFPRDSGVMHLLGLARDKAGASDDAEKLLRASIEIDPRPADYHVNLAGLMRRRGRLADAERSYRNALLREGTHRIARLGLVRTLNDGKEHAAAEAEARTLTKHYAQDPEAWSALAMCLRDQNRYSDAAIAYQQSIQLAPRYGQAYHNLGSMLVRMERSEEALQVLDRAASVGISGFPLHFNRARALLQLYRIDEAEREMAAAVALEPGSLEAQVNLTKIRFMRGDPRFARDLQTAASAQPANMALQLVLSDVLRRAGDIAGAESLLRSLLARGSHPELHSALAAVLFESNRLSEAEAEALTAIQGAPRNVLTTELLVGIMLSRGRAEDAVPFIDIQRKRAPLDQGWIAYQATAARLLGKPEYQDLYDYDGLVRVYDLEPPPGWSSMEEINQALLEVLNPWHAFPIHPLDQSLRNGSQTARSLVGEKHPAIQAAFQAFAAPLEHYLKDIGQHDSHPFRMRNRGGVEITGAWSVQLRREGFHVNHFHPQGWISSAYYVSVPEETRDETLQSGWIRFGEPRYAVPGATPERIVQPRAGRLVLFPSYMWHGTSAIHGSDPRTTIAFDANPV